MKTVLVTGGSGFFGGTLKKRLLRDGAACVNVDLNDDGDSHPGLTFVRADIVDASALERVFAARKFDCVFHCAAMLSHQARSPGALWATNVEGTRHVAQLAAKYGVPRLVFVSTNCLWAESADHPVAEDETPRPREIYGESKLAGERLLSGFAASLGVAVIRAPTIVGTGRLGLLSILFQFILEGRRVWTVGPGDNRIQTVDADDLADACVRAMDRGASGVFHVGCDGVKPIREVYEYVIRRAGTHARVAALPRAFTLAAMRAAYFLRLSPMGPYQYKAIAESFEFDTSKARRELGWKPANTSEQSFYKAFEYYRDNLASIGLRRDVSPHKRPAKMGIIRLLKWIS